MNADKLPTGSQEAIWQKALIDSALDAVMVIDEDGYLLDINRSAEVLFGYPKESIIGQLIGELIVPDALREAHTAGLKRIRTTGVPKVLGQRLELPAIRSDGSEFPVELIVAQVAVSPRPVYVGTVRDITDRKEAEQMLTSALHEAQAANNAKSEFLALVSHEMRTPLNSIIGTLDLTMHTELNAEQQELLDMCVRSGSQLKALIDDVLDYTQIKTGRFALQPQVMVLPEILLSAQETFARQAQDKGLEFRWQVSPEIPSLLWGDGGRVYQVIDNLLNNAIKFTDGGYVAFRAEQLHSNEAGVSLRFTVEDTGIGVATGHRDQIFNRFEQVDSGATRVFGGLGLGLSVCDQLVELMGGEICCDEADGGGSRFVFNVQFNRPTELQIEEYGLQSSEQPEAEISFCDVHVLMAEDDPASSVVATRMLQNAGVTVKAVPDGRQAVEEFRQHPNRYSAVFMDMMMPVMDGIEATRQIRELQQKKIPVIALTAKTMDGDRERILHSSLDAYIAKPIERKKLLMTLRQMIGPDDGAEFPVGDTPVEHGSEVLDAVALCHRCDNSRELLEEIAELFGKTCDDALRKIQDSLNRNDHSGTVRAAHLLKGSVSNMCASYALRVAERVELAARRSELEAAREMMPELRNEVQKLRNAIESVLSDLT